MNLSRRQWLKGSVAAGTIALSGCERLISRVTGRLGQNIPDHIAVADSPEIDPDFHLLSRASYGPWPGDLDRIRAIGQEAWLDEQLSPEAIDDTAADLRARRFEVMDVQPGTCYEFTKEVIRQELDRHTILHAVYSKRQLFEVMAGFWSDHFNIYLEKGDCIYLKPADDREVIRAHALGRFRDLVRASATSPAMLVYLDGKENKKETPSDVPNENYARELLELHTLGVNGGYTQKDVSEAARCLTGWRLRTKWRRGTVFFDPALHDNGSKTLMGHEIAPGRGARDLEDVIDIACGHPATAQHIAYKLARKFVSEHPPEPLVSQAAEEFSRTRGDIKSVLRVIFRSGEFRLSKGAKLKTPFRFVVSCLRALGADTHAHEKLISYLNRMGHAPYEHPAPDGYPDQAGPWLSTLLWRWNFGLALASNSLESTEVSIQALSRAIGGFNPPRLLAHFIGRAPTPVEVAGVSSSGPSLFGHSTRAGVSEQPALVGLMLASPAFQMH